MRRMLILCSLSILLLFGISGCSEIENNSNRIALNDNWKFRNTDDTTYIKASVPGLVQLDLLNAGIINNPFWGANSDSIQWIENEDWEYINDFDVPGEFLNQSNIELVFEGLDTYANVYLNNLLILRANNMFRTWKVDVTESLKTSNKLKIIFQSTIKKNRDAAYKLNYELPEESVHTRKAPYQFGWDWGPRIVTSGIWRPIYLQAWKKVKINSTCFKTDSITEQKAYVSAMVEINSEIEGPIKLEFSTENKRIATQEVILQKGINYELVQFEIDQPKLWWTNGLGESHLYNIKTQLISNKQIIDSKTDNIGIRTVEIIQEKDKIGESFLLKLNGIPIFMKGANYIPQDNLLPRVDSINYRNIIENATLANMNMLRVWGGGIYEEDYFYDLCDESGILIWQDFMFAGSMYPGNPDFIENVKQEAIDNVKRLRNHPSIAFWCGNNEIDEGWHNWGWQQQFQYSEQEEAEIWEAYKILFHQTLPEVIKAYDPDRFYWQSSPKIGWGHPESLLEGDAHYWGVWWGEEPFEIYEKKVGRFMSEFGFQGFPPTKTFDSILNHTDKYLYSPTLKTHQKHPRGFEIIHSYMQRDYKIPENFEDYVYISQLLQANGVGKALEAHRRAMPYCMGTLYWQLNDCWPVISWSSTDYYNNWKALHFTAKKAFNEVMISIEEKNDSVYVHVVSDLLKDFDSELKLQILDFRGDEKWSFTTNLAVQANSSNIVFKESVDQLIKSKANYLVLEASILNNKNEIINRLHYFVPAKELKLIHPAISYKIESTTEGLDITLETDYLAKNLFLDFEKINGRFSNNYFDLIPGRSVTVKFYSENRINNIAELKIKSLIDCY